MCVWRKGIISLVVTKSAPSSDSASEDINILIIVVMVRTGPLNAGEATFSERKMWEPARLRNKLLLRYEASVCAAKKHITSL